MRIYYGWYIVAVALVVLTLVLGSTFHSFGVFVRPVSEEFGLSRADANTGLIFLNLGSAVCAPIIGKLLDRTPLRRVMLVCAFVMGASLATLGLSHSLPLSAFVLAVPLAIGLQGGGTLTATTLVARWFTVHRGRAMAIALFGMSLAGVLVTPAIAYGVEHYQWRQTLIVVGGVVTVLLLAMVAIVREKPGPNDIESTKPAAQPQAGRPAAAAADAKPLTAVQLLLMPQFWIIGVTSALTLGFTSAVMITFVPLAEGIGIGPTQAASLIAILASAGLVGGLVVAAIADRVDRMLLLSVLFVFVAGAGGLLYVSHSFNLLVAGAALLGFTTGMASPAFHALIADRFGAASFGTAYGLMSVLMTVLGALAVRYAGEVFDRLGSYDWFFLTIVGAELIAAALLFAARMLSAPAIAPAVGSEAPAHH